MAGKTWSVARRGGTFASAIGPVPPRPQAWASVTRLRNATKGEA